MRGVGSIECSRIESGFRACLQRRTPPVREAIDPAVAAVFGVEIGDLRATTRGSPRAAFARQVAMYLAHVAPLSLMPASWSRMDATIPSSTGGSSIWNGRSAR